MPKMWRCSANANAELVANLSAEGYFRSERVGKALLSVDRANYVKNKIFAYEDYPQSIDHGATISAPHMHASATEYLLPYLHPGARVLDVGSGSGYLSAVFHHLVSGTETARPTTAVETTTSGAQPRERSGKGRVVGIEHIPELVTWSKLNLRADGLGDALESGAIEIVVGDGRRGK
ncbi:hypothetical protein AX16_008182 [Volvariella volvacea WC 439]|nr:hypothetical protein AX16_008182 [Volvariella volvacea WC 439]